jgi:hypothetical protein
MLLGEEATVSAGRLYTVTVARAGNDTQPTDVEPMMEYVVVTFGDTGLLAFTKV